MITSVRKIGAQGPGFSRSVNGVIKVQMISPNLVEITKKIDVGKTWFFLARL